MFGAINIAGSGISATHEWMEVTANNIANINTTRTQDGNPYYRQTVTLESKKAFDDMFQKEVGSGVKIDQVTEDQSEKLLFDPDHPDANEEGYVRYPAIDLAAELTNMIQAQRSYEANVTSLNTIKKMMLKEQEIGRA